MNAVQRRNKPGIKRTDDVIDRIVRLLWQTFAVTTLCAIIDVILYLTVRKLPFIS